MSQKSEENKDSKNVEVMSTVTSTTPSTPIDKDNQLLKQKPIDVANNRKTKQSQTNLLSTSSPAFTLPPISPLLNADIAFPVDVRTFQEEWDRREIVITMNQLSSFDNMKLKQYIHLLSERIIKLNFLIDQLFNLHCENTANVKWFLRHKQYDIRQYRQYLEFWLSTHRMIIEDDDEMSEDIDSEEEKKKKKTTTMNNNKNLQTPDVAAGSGNKLSTSPSIIWEKEEIKEKKLKFSTP